MLNSCNNKKVAVAGGQKTTSSNTDIQLQHCLEDAGFGVGISKGQGWEVKTDECSRSFLFEKGT